MQHRSLWFPALLVALLLPLSGCDLAGDLLEAGFWAGVVVGGLVVAIPVWLLRRFFRR
jgi:hypothetical protein